MVRSGAAASRTTHLLAAVLLLFATPAAAGDVISAGPASVAVTVYRDDAVPDPAAAQWGGLGLGMITETRVVELPAGESRLVLEAVADGALPETAAIEGLPGQIKEQSFDYDLLSPGSLIEHSVGRPVELVRINRKTGARTTEDATLLSGPNGLVLDVGGRIEALGCSGGIEGLVFSGVPAELTGKAALSTHVTVSRPGRYRLTLSYLTVGLAWNASYVARLAPDASRLDLTGWITLANHGDTGFADALTSVVAGRLERQAVQRVEAVLARRRSACWPMGNSHHPRGERLYVGVLRAPPTGGMVVSEIVVVADRREQRLEKVPIAVTAFTARQSDLGDYKLYTLPAPTTLAARQTKQVAFLEQAGVSFQRLYVLKMDASGGNGSVGPSATAATLRFQNKPASGLGRALPAGSVSLRQTQGDGDYLLGEPRLEDVAVGSPFELEVGDAPDVEASWRVTAVVPFTRHGVKGRRVTVVATLTNAKRQPVTGEVRQAAQYLGFKLLSESARHATRGGDPVWDLTVPANGTASVRFTAEFQ